MSEIPSLDPDKSLQEPSIATTAEHVLYDVGFVVKFPSIVVEIGGIFVAEDLLEAGDEGNVGIHLSRSTWGWFLALGRSDTGIEIARLVAIRALLSLFEKTHEATTRIDTTIVEDGEHAREFRHSAADDVWRRSLS